MSIFEEKPLQVEAVQWDGTIEGAHEVRNLMSKSNVRYGFFIRTELGRSGGSESSVSRIEFDFGAGDRQTMYQTDWVVLNLRNQTLKILPDRTFQRDYKEIS